MASIKYKDNGSYKDIVVKVGDTLPIGAEIDYEGSSVPNGWEQVSKVLWEDASGTHENFSLNENVKNYDRIEIVFGRSSWTTMKQAQINIINKGTGTNPCGLTAMYPSGNNNALIVANAVMEIGSDGTSVTFPRMTSGFIQNENGYVKEEGSYLNVYKVTGFKD